MGDFLVASNEKFCDFLLKNRSVSTVIFFGVFVAPSLSPLSQNHGAHYDY